MAERRADEQRVVGVEGETLRNEIDVQAISVFRLCIAPLGEPVVPDVNISTAISSGGRAPIPPMGAGGEPLFA